MTIDVDGLEFDFPNGWSASKYDEWSYYRNQFRKMRNEIKSIDLLAQDLSDTVWLIEAKDYSQQPRTKPSSLAEEVASKVFDTLAALLPAAVNANDAQEVGAARSALGAKRLRVVLHLEQPAKHSKLFPRAINPADVQQELRRLLKPIDAHPVVAEKAAMRSLAWSVR